MARASGLVWSEGSVTSVIGGPRFGRPATRAIGLAVLALTLTAANASPQAALPDRRTTVFVTFANPPVEIEGTLTSLTEQAVALVVDGAERTIPLTDVSRIDRDGDPSWDRALVAGLAVGTWCAIVCGQGLDDAGQLSGAVLVNALVSGAIGWAIDRAHHGRTTLFKAGRR